MSMNIWGLGSNMDTGLMIEQLMQLERVPYNKLVQKQKDYGEYQSFFRTMNTKLSSLKDKASELTLNAHFQLTSTKSSDEQAVKVSSSDKAVTGNYSVSVEQLAKSHVIKSHAYSETTKTLVGTTFSIGTEEPYTVKGNNDIEVLEDLKNYINRNSKEVSAAVVETEPGKKTLVLTAVKTGEQNSFGDKDGSGIKLGGDILKEMGLFEAGHEVQAAANAVVKVNGLTVTSTSNEVKGVIEGVTLKLMKEKSTAMVTVGQDSDKVLEKVKDFVKAFNDVRKLIRDNTGKGQPLQGDSTMRQLDSELTDWVTNNLPGLGTLVDIGIEMDKGKTKGEEMTGELTLDEKKFKEMLEKDPDKVMSLFNIDKTEGSAELKGVATIMNDKLRIWTSSANGLIQSRIKGYDADIAYVKDSIEGMENRLNMKEKQLKKQFTAMEVALGQLKNQQSWLNGQIAALSKKD